MNLSIIMTAIGAITSLATALPKLIADWAAIKAALDQKGVSLETEIGNVIAAILSLVGHLSSVFPPAPAASSTAATTTTAANDDTASASG